MMGVAGAVLVYDAQGAPISPSLNRRLGAMVYESVLLFGVSFIAGYLFDTLTQSRNALMYRHAREAWLFLIFGVYFVYFWTHSGQTLAMKTWRMRLCLPGREQVPLSFALLRYVLSWFFILLCTGLAYAFSLPPGLMLLSLALGVLVPPFFVFIDRDRQYWHDRLLGTRIYEVVAAAPDRATL